MSASHSPHRTSSIMARSPVPHECALCDQKFSTKPYYYQHMLNHNTQPPTGTLICSTCNTSFDDSLALEHHQRESGHGDQHECDNCHESFPTLTLLSRHKQFPLPCSDAFSRRGSIHYCEVCEKSFYSQAAYNHHFLGCSLPASLAQASHPSAPAGPSNSVPVLYTLDHIPQIITDNTLQHATTLTPAGSQVPHVQSSAQLAPPLPQGPDVFTTATRVCGICNMFFHTYAALHVHRQDRHGLSVQGLDRAGKDSRMLSQSSRQQLKDAGVLKSSPGPSNVRSHRSGPAGVSNHQPSRPVQSHPATAQQIQVHIAPVGGLEEMNQARHICGQIMRLVLQSDIFIYHTGNMKCSGIDWTRISSAKQVDLVGMFAGLCHLPAVLQSTEFVPPPKTFKDDYRSNYPVADFKLSPEPMGSTALRIVSIACTKVLFQNHLQEAVKIAAVDVISCRVLFNHLISVDTTAPVMNWRTSITGLSSYQHIDHARQDGYKVFKGWNAARAALWKFIDRNTIIVGYNLRADLDSLRMIHGRAVDVAKIYENAARGPLSKQQLSLESLCRDLPKKKLTTDLTFGRDTLQNAFAARELGLWMLKNTTKLEQIARQTSLDYQLLV